MVLLDILIPTYNRNTVLAKNVELIANYIDLLNVHNQVRIIIRDNKSPQDITPFIQKVQGKFPLVNLRLSINNVNIGLKRNILAVLGDSDSKFIMFLGDDDFINIKYFQYVVELIEEDKNLGFVLPSRTIINPNYNLDEINHTNQPLETEKIENRFTTRHYYSSQCNQLSGIIYRNIDLYKKSCSQRLDNLYPFMTFGGWCLQDMNGYYVKNNPVLVTEGHKKDWGYGENGLLPDIIDNVKHFSEGYFYRILGELLYASYWNDRLSIYWVKGYKAGFRQLINLFNDKKLTFFTKLYLIPLAFYVNIRILIAKFRGTLNSPHI